ncbi:MATE family efflux transporter [Lachnospiraceae bacterium JLR.KK008]
MEIGISKKFTLPGLVRFSFPAIIMLILSSVYTTVDGIFVSRFVGSDALSALNIVLPVEYFVYGVAVMFGSGGSAVIGRKLGEGKTEEAKDNFTLITLTALICGVLITVVVQSGLVPISGMLGASERLLPLCAAYGKVLFAFIVFHIIQVMYNTFFVTAGKPALALVITVLCGLMNICLDYLFIVVFDMGIAGAAWGTVLSRAFGGIFPLFYFMWSRTGLCYVRPHRNVPMLLRAMANGSSEMVANLATAVTTFLFNVTMMRLTGEDGVAAVSIILYAQYVFTAIFFGFSTSAAPIISYNYGCGDTAYLKKLFRYCLWIIGGSTMLMIGTVLLTARPLIGVFAPEGSNVYALTYHGYLLFIWNFLFAGYNIFSSALFSAFSNGLVSAVISFLRTLVFIVIAVLTLPFIWGIDGLWLAVPAAEALTFLVAVFCLVRYGKRTYHYL